MENILIAVIPSLLTFLGVVVTVHGSNRKLTDDIKLENSNSINKIKLEITAYHASTDEKIKELTREVREHNNFAKRMPVVENDIKHIEAKMNELHR